MCKKRRDKLWLQYRRCFNRQASHYLFVLMSERLQQSPRLRSLPAYSIVSSAARELHNNKVGKTVRRGTREERDTGLKWEAAN